MECAPQLFEAVVGDAVTPADDLRLEDVAARSFDDCHRGGEQQQRQKPKNGQIHGSKVLTFDDLPIDGCGLISVAF